VNSVELDYIADILKMGLAHHGFKCGPNEPATFSCWFRVIKDQQSSLTYPNCYVDIYADNTIRVIQAKNTYTNHPGQTDVVYLNISEPSLIDKIVSHIRLFNQE